MSRFTDIILHIFLPNKCMFCRNPIEYDKTICNECAKIAPCIDENICPGCGKTICSCKNNYYSSIICPFYYEMGADNAVRDLKFSNNKLNARKLAKYMAVSLQNRKIINEIDMIIPAPLYKTDYNNRGYNQSELLAKWVSEYVSIPMDNKLLKKIKKTKKQHDLNAVERQTNLDGSFVVSNHADIFEKTILLIDDVFTTGATINACSKILLENGAENIVCLTATKTRGIVK